MLRFDCISLFPEMLSGFISCSMIGRAIQNKLIEVALHNLRDWAVDKHHITDDSPFGGGAGMVMKPEPIFAAVRDLRKKSSKVIFLCPDGQKLSSDVAKRLAEEENLILLSGHYEGVDERVREHLVDEEISIGDYILTNGTLASAVLIDAVTRYIPGVLGAEQSLEQDSFSDGLLTFPQYTRPADFQGLTVPEVLLSGNHTKIAEWREQQRVARTMKRRSDLMKGRV